MEKRNTAGGQLLLSYRKKMEIEYRLMGLKPKKPKAYLLCIGLGTFGAHRFYLGDRETGMKMLLLGITIIGLPATLVWALRDLVRLPAMIRQRTDEIRRKLTADATGGAT